MSTAIPRRPELREGPRHRRELALLEVACDRSAAARVRQTICAIGQLGAARSDATLVASELVAAVARGAGEHHGRKLSLRVSTREDTIRIAVTAPVGGADPPELDALARLIVEALTQRWASSREPTYGVWAELALPMAPPKSPRREGNAHRAALPRRSLITVAAASA